MKFEETPTTNGHVHDNLWERQCLIKDLEIGDDHVGTSTDTPMRPDAFDISYQQKMVRIEKHFREIMVTLGLDLTDDSLRGTPRRVAKMYVEEFFSGLDPANKPSISLFDNKFGYHQMLVEKNITLHSHCEHHFVPITGVVHIAYMPKGKVIGLSKLNRIARYYAKRPQVQERLTMQIAHELQEILGTPDVAVMIDAVHHCVCSRGIEDQGSSTITVEYGGKFLETRTRDEFLSHLR
ncbi:MAG: GTP cyclohydrolase I FolE [Saprospiraceae bacterium]|nr:GTP cyclohydrolase I FolE [Saprospiraceae bacterium]